MKQLIVMFLIKEPSTGYSISLSAFNNVGEGEALSQTTTTQELSRKSINAYYKRIQTAMY